MSAPRSTPVGEAGSLRRTANGDRLYRALITLAAATVPALLLLLTWQLWRSAQPAMGKFGFGFIVSGSWDPVLDDYGAGPLVAGSILTALGAALLAAPFAIGGAIWSVEFVPRRLKIPLTALIDLLAAIPGVVYGLWGVLVMLPWCRTHLYAGTGYGPSILTAILLLAVMMFPFLLGTLRDLFQTVPRAHRDAALALGATRWEAVRTALLPSTRSGIVGSILLAAGRAFGEAMAVAMVIGASHAPVGSLLAPGFTLAAVLPHEFIEAVSGMHIASLSYAAFILFIVTVATNAAARALLVRASRHPSLGGDR
jgi:phosphate transport system permease protein